MKQELLTLGEHMGSFPAFCGITECCSYFLAVCVVFLTLFVYSIIVPNISCVSGMSTGACYSCQSRDKKNCDKPPVDCLGHSMLLLLLLLPISTGPLSGIFTGPCHYPRKYTINA